MPGRDRMLEGKTVLITGAGSGLGRSYALASAAAGARVVVNDQHAHGLEETARQIRSAGGIVHSLVARVGNESVARELVAASVERFGTLDGLVANAGVLNPGLSRDQSAADVADTIATNVAGVWHCSVAAMEVMVASGTGSIVTIVSGAMQGLPGLALYGTSKSAVLGMTYGLAIELEGSGVRINAVSPLAHTPMSDSMDVHDDAKGGPATAVAPVVVHLLSDRARGLNGQVIRFDGRRLGLVAPPRLAVTMSERATWSADDIAEAFAGPLLPATIPVGLVAAVPPVVADA